MAGRRDDTIAAIATAAGEGALAVVRMSGASALAVADAVFRGRRPLAEAEPYTLHVGRVVDGAGEEVDDVVAGVFRAPRSYTGEDLIELTCHGGVQVSRRVLEVLLAAGARQAEPGEFTRRAFLNGKMDLAQAEAVADLIAARSERARRQSLAQLRGRLSTDVDAVRGALLDLCALLELDLDFAEEGLAVVPPADVELRIASLAERLDRLLASWSSGRLVRDGVQVVLAGLPNAGKSSLFNALLRESRAIVTAVPGTTRDALEENIVIDGVLFRVVDTAGLRETEDTVEREGVLRSRSSLQLADVVLLVVDAAAMPTAASVPPEVRIPERRVPVVVAWNKMDISGALVEPARLAEAPDAGWLHVGVSARTGSGIAELERNLVLALGIGSADSAEGVHVASERHRAALKGALAPIRRALEGSRAGMSNELLAFELREAAAALGSICGEVTTDEILNAIFARFCIGK
jgi:tRNA modification GTPase